MGKIKTAVVGVGYLGRFHAQKYKALDSCELVAVCDSSDKNLKSVSQELSVEAFSNYQDLLGI